MAKDCPKGYSVCFHCNQTGHRKAECTQLTQGPSQTSAPAALRVIDGHPGKAKAPRARGRAFQLTAEEFPTTPDVVVGTYLLIHVILRFFYAYTVFHIGIFL